MNPLVILSGFGKFDGVPVNPTEEIINILREQGWQPPGEIDFQTEVVTCSTSGADETINKLNSSSCSDREVEARIHLGVHGKAVNYFLESTAYNNMTFRCADESGYQPTNQCIDEESELEMALMSTLPLSDLREELTAKGFPVEISTDPGRFLCNYIYYKSLCYCVSASNTRYYALFIHIPPTSVIPLEQQVEFVKQAVNSISAVL